MILHEFEQFIPELDKKNLILAPFCGEPSCEDNIKKESTRYCYLLFYYYWNAIDL